MRAAQRANDETEMGYELKEDDDLNVDHLEKRKLLKKQRVIQNKKNHLRNLVCVCVCVLAPSLAVT